MKCQATATLIPVWSIRVLLQANGRPILKLDRRRFKATPTGWTEVEIDGVAHEFNFVKEFINVARRSGTEENVVPELLQHWFGPQAGQPGTHFHVLLSRHGDEWGIGPG